MKPSSSRERERRTRREEETLPAGVRDVNKNYKTTFIVMWMVPREVAVHLSGVREEIEKENR